MSKEENVIKYYVTCNKLKDVIRSGWKDWNVKRERVESVAEHVFGVQMIAIAMKSEFNYDIDIMKVIYMLSIHEIGESIIGDLTLFDISKEEKDKIETEAVSIILKDLVDGEKIKELFLEFNDKKTKEAKFANMCDKLECDIQSKLYDLDGCVDLNNQPNNKSLESDVVKDLIKDGNSWSSMWLKFGQKIHNYDENFMKVSNYVLSNNIKE